MSLSSQLASLDIEPIDDDDDLPAPSPSPAVAAPTPTDSGSSSKKKLKKKKKKASVSFSKLPVEIKLRIIDLWVHLEFVGTDTETFVQDNTIELAPLAGVNVEMYRLTAQWRWKVVDLSNRRNQDILHFIRDILPRHGKHITHLATDLVTPFEGSNPRLWKAATDLCGLKDNVAYFLEKTPQQKCRSARHFLYAVVVARASKLEAINLHFQHDQGAGLALLMKTIRDAAPKIKDLTYAVEGPADYRKLGNFLLPFTELDHLEIDCPEALNEMDVDPPELIKSLLRMTKLEHLVFKQSQCLTHRLASADWSRVPLKYLQVAGGGPIFLSTSFDAHSLAAMLPQFADTLKDLSLFSVTPPSFDAFGGINLFRTRKPAPPTYYNPFTLPHLKRLDFTALDSDHSILQAFRTCPIEDILLGQFMDKMEDEPALSVLQGWKKTLRKVRLAEPSRSGKIEKLAEEVGARLDADWFKSRGLKGWGESDEESGLTDDDSDSEEGSEGDDEGEKDVEEPWMKDLSEEDRKLLRYADDMVCMVEYGKRKPGKEIWSVAEFKRKLGLRE
ncbi:hypothetical protein BCR35DRAFT_310662 [Leucosporidium creatinivorum]|uniref:Uncharacterized protein n=1 Tax=Leucosporidium creatinivorum TaxID=106004 RepID=A0A1Y2CYR9_9BASI|nr:hypothetical protein BCR35DRAFT_310662 [Leucosporidium creatinivorum]